LLIAILALCLHRVASSWKKSTVSI
jgi:hypothetical protein